MAQRKLTISCFWLCKPADIESICDVQIQLDLDCSILTVSAQNIKSRILASLVILCLDSSYLLNSTRFRYELGLFLVKSFNQRTSISNENSTCMWGWWLYWGAPSKIFKRQRVLRKGSWSLVSQILLLMSLQDSPQSARSSKWVFKACYFYFIELSQIHASFSFSLHKV